MRVRGLLFLLVALACLGMGMRAQAAVVAGPFTNVGTQNTTIVANGDFSAGLSGWSFYGGNGSFAASTFWGPDGNEGTALSITGAGGTGQSGYAEQTTASLAGGTYYLSGFIFFEGTATGNAYVDLNDTSFDPDVQADPSIKGTWQFVYQQFTVSSATSVTVRLVRDTYASAGDHVYFDRISITPVTNTDVFVLPSQSSVEPNAVPLPSAAWSGLALLGLAIARRSRR